MNPHATLAHCKIGAYGARPSRHDDAILQTMNSMQRLSRHPRHRDLRIAMRGDVVPCPFAGKGARPV
jgi:hypothetical protein